MLDKPDWTAMSKQQHIDAVRPYLEQGMSAGEISRQFSNCSRCSIIGVAHRGGLRLMSRNMGPRRHVEKAPNAKHGNAGVPSVKSILHRVEARLKARSRIPEQSEDGVDVTRLIGLVQLTERTCKWPESGQGASTLFCGKPKEFDVKQPYCEHHARQARAG